MVGRGPQPLRAAPRSVVGQSSPDGGTVAGLGPMSSRREMTGSGPVMTGWSGGRARLVSPLADPPLADRSLAKRAPVLRRAVAALRNMGASPAAIDDGHRLAPGLCHADDPGAQC